MKTALLKEGEHYLRKVSARLNLPVEIKKRVIHDLRTSILARQEAGEYITDILNDMGAASDVAAEINEQMKDYAYIKRPVRFAFLAICIGALLLMLSEWILSALFTWSLGEMASLGVIGGADGPTAIFVTKSQTTGIPWNDILTLALVFIGAAGYWHFGHVRKKL